jgi:hypothetical protein
VCDREGEWKEEKLGVIVLRDREKRRKLGMIVKIRLTANLSRNRSGRADLKEGANEAVWKWLPQKKPNNRKEGDADQTSQAQRTEERKGDTPLGYSGRIALRREQELWHPNTLPRLCNSTRSGVFSVPGRAEPRGVAHRVALPRLVRCQATAINTWMTQE